MTSRLRSAWLVALLLLPLRAFAVDVIDDGRVIDELKGWYKARPFEQAMACGQSATFESTHDHCDVRCNNGYCITKCSSPKDPAQGRYKLFVDECSADLAHVFGENGLIVEIPRAEFETQGGHWVVPFLSQVGQFLQPEGTVHLKDRWTKTVAYIEDGRMRSIRVFEIRGEIRFEGAAQGLEFQLWLTDELDGVRQIVRFATGSTVFLRLRGIIEGR